MVDVSIIIVSYNTRGVTLRCLRALHTCLCKESNKQLSYEVLVVDNASTDDSVEAIRSFVAQHSYATFIRNNKNVGFGRANNQALRKSKGEYVLYLNSDVIVDVLDFTDLIDQFRQDTSLGVLTTYVQLASGSMDEASHRGFPTLWRSFCYFAGLERHLAHRGIFPNVFGGYHLVGRDLTKSHEIDSPSGAFYLIRGDLAHALGGFDEDFFMYGEDLDLSYRVKKRGFRVLFYPRYTVLHLKGQSGIKNKKTALRRKIRHHFYDAMHIFYRKHYASGYPFVINWVVYGILWFKIRSI